MRLLYCWILVFTMIFMTTTIWYGFAPLAFKMFDASDDFAEDLTGEAEQTYLFMSDALRYLYWLSFMGIIIAYIVWGFLYSQQRDYESTGGYYR